MTPSPQVSGNRRTGDSGSGNRVRDTFRADFVASIVVFLVALPLCIGIAVAVGVSPTRALITGIIGGIVVGWFAGAPLQVSGPAAGLFVIIADILAVQRESYLENMEAATAAAAEVHALAALGVSVFLAGWLQVFAGRLSLGQWFRAVSPAVIKGMLSGIGLLILVSQLHVMLDHKALWHGKPAHGGLEYIATIPEAIWKCIAGDETMTHHLAAGTGILTIVTIVVWQLVASRRLKLIPAALVGVVVASVFAFVTQLDIMRLEIPDRIWSDVSLPNWQWLPILADSRVVLASIVIALVASAETLLCATAVDQIADNHRTHYDQELTSQGIGNVLCGLVGALPMTGVIVRSSANVHAGAKTRLSSMLHGVWLLLFVAFLPHVLAHIPRSAMGALLVYTGYKLLNLRQIRELWRVGKSEVVIYFTTLTLIVVFDLLVGVVAGFLLSAALLLHRFARLEVQLTEELADGRATLRLAGAATFLRLPVLAERLERVSADTELHIDLSQLDYIDHACFQLIMDWADQHRAAGGNLILDWDRLRGQFGQITVGTAKATP